MNVKNIKEDKIIQWLIRWAEDQQTVRAMILTSSRTNPFATIDLFSDYDVILVVTDIQPFFQDKSYLGDYGKVLVVYKNPLGEQNGFEHFADITQYEDGTKIDYSFSPVEWLCWMAEQAELPEHLDNGYLVLLDKDRLDDLIPLKYNLDFAMKFHLLRQTLEWRMEIDHAWSVKTGAYGKGLKKRLPLEIWSELEDTCAGAERAENWKALYRTIAFFRKVAIQVGDYLGYDYPHELHRRVLAYLMKVEHLDL